MNAYKTLGITNPDCSDDAVRSAYRNLVAVHHPDAGGNQTAFREIHSAYQLVRTREARRAYDAALIHKVVDRLVETTARIVDEFFEACAPRMEDGK